MRRQGTFHQLVFHFVWSTCSRQPLISPSIEQKLFPYIRRKCVERGYFLYAVNGTADHLHVLLELSPMMLIADVAKLLKGASSHYINHDCELDGTLYWQDGYGVISIRRAEVPTVARYIQNQKQHHLTGHLSDLYERIES